MKIFLLNDSGGDIPFISDNLKDKYELDYLRYRCKSTFWELVKGAFEALIKTEKKDTIVCWYDFQAILCYYLGLVLFKKRKIVCLNILLKDKDTLKNKVVSWMYKVMLSDMNVVASVTSKEYGVHVRERLGISKELFLLHDVFYDGYTVNQTVRVNPNQYNILWRA